MTAEQYQKAQKSLRPDLYPSDKVLFDHCQDQIDRLLRPSARALSNAWTDCELIQVDLIKAYKYCTERATRSITYKAEKYWIKLADRLYSLYLRQLTLVP